MSRYLNNKNKELYTVLDWEVIDATNGREDHETMVLYRNVEGKKFVRTATEFEQKFTRI